MKRVIACSGKVFYDSSRTGASTRSGRRDRPPRAAVSVPARDFRAALAKYPQAKEVIWCQEEPQNQGAWYRFREYFRADALPNQVVAYAGRPVSASTAVGYMSKHLAAAEATDRRSVRAEPRHG